MTRTHFIRLGSTVLGAAILSACSHTSQFTSGKSYLNTYEHPAYAASTSIDQEVRDIAAIEPRLEFPARIGLARIQKGRLTSIPGDEVTAWQTLKDDLGGTYGDFVPVSPLVAAMVSRPAEKGTAGAKRVVDDIRRGSARQHLDYVLIYEVTQMSGKTSNALRLTDLSILGLYVMPSRKVEIEATASAMLIDVRNGYPYGSASAYAEKAETVTVAGLNTAKIKLSGKSRVQAVENLTGDVAAFLEELKTASRTLNMAETETTVPKVATIGTNRH